MLNGFGCYCDDINKNKVQNGQIKVPAKRIDFAVGNVAIEDICLHVVYNQDTSYNDNTCNYCLRHPIDLNDFHCITYAQEYSQTADKMNYQFTSKTIQYIILFHGIIK